MNKLAKKLLAKHRSNKIRKFIEEERKRQGIIDPKDNACDKGLYAPWVPTNDDVIKQFIELVNINNNDIICDLGCGDARVLIACAKKFGNQCIGVELDDKMFERAKAEVSKLDENISKKIQLLHMSVGDERVIKSLKHVTVVFVFMLPNVVSYIENILIKELPDHARIVTYTFKLPNIEADDTIAVGSGVTSLYLYKLTPELRETLINKE